MVPGALLTGACGLGEQRVDLELNRVAAEHRTLSAPWLRAPSDSTGSRGARGTLLQRRRRRGVGDDQGGERLQVRERQGVEGRGCWVGGVVVHAPLNGARGRRLERI